MPRNRKNIATSPVPTPDKEPKQKSSCCKTFGLIILSLFLIYAISSVLPYIDFNYFSKTDEILDERTISKRVVENAVKALQYSKDDIEIIRSMIEVGKLVNQSSYVDKIIPLLKKSNFDQLAWKATIEPSKQCDLMQNYQIINAILYVLHDSIYSGAEFDINLESIETILKNCAKLEDPPFVLLRVVDLIAEKKKIDSGIIPILDQYSTTTGFGPWSRIIARLMANVDEISEENKQIITKFLDFSLKSKENWGKEFRPNFCALSNRISYEKSKDICSNENE